MCIPFITSARLYSVWAAVGPLVGVFVGAWLSNRWQRKKWILDNKTSEYRGLLDALNDYRFSLTEYYALYKFAMVAVPAQKKYDDDIAFAKAQSAVSNAFADRIFIRRDVERRGARDEWRALAAKLLADKSTSDELLKMIDTVHSKLVKASQADLKLEQSPRFAWIRRIIKIRTLVVLALLFTPLAFGQVPPKNGPSTKETLHWMQTTLDDGAGDYLVGHEVRSIRLEDFDGCKVHFHYSVHQEPFLNGEPAPDKKSFHQDYFFELSDIDPNATTFSKGPRLDAQSLVTIHTRNDEKRITIQSAYESREEAKPDVTFLIFSLTSFDSEYVVRFTKAFKHAVESCGGKPSTF